MINPAAARLNMVDGQLRTNRITDEALLDAFLTVPRERFVPAALRGIAYVDNDIPLGDGRALIQPMVLGRLLQLARVGGSDKALEIGSATGYATALLARLAGRVVALESNARLAAAARLNLGRLEVANAQVVEGPLQAGWPADAPYDVILLNGAAAEIPAAISGQLAEGGRLVGVIEPEASPPRAVLGRAIIMTRAEGRLSRRVVFDAAIHRLPGFAPAPSFVF